MRRATGWRRLVGSPKLQIIFHKRATKYRSLLRKMTYKDKGSYESSPPYTRMNEACYTYEWDILDIRMSHVTHMSRYKNKWVMSHTCEWVMSHIWVRLVTRVTESHEFMSHVANVWMGHVAHMSEACHTCDWVTRIHESCQRYAWVMSHTWMRHVTHINEQVSFGVGHI